ncbi:MAG TPA: hypothetical protein VMW08_14150 [Acidimicrobiales bacterium]|nr:hypothetical protein [Acidimicrobiales bacterium]
MSASRQVNAVTSRSRLLLVSDIVVGIDPAMWADALRRAGWGGPVEAHIHPGRQGDVALPGGNHEPLDPAFALGGTDAIGEAVVVVGFGRSGPVAQLAGLGGRAAAVAVVDGLGGPFVEPAEQIAATLDMMRATMADEASHSLPAPSEVDRRLGHGLTPHRDRPTAERMIEAMPVPMLVVETADSPLDASTVDELTSSADRGRLTVTRVGRSTPDRVATEVADALVTWVSDLGRREL